jgi:RNA polymerase sigma-70 factor (ECF subfamily)
MTFGYMIFRPEDAESTINVTMLTLVARLPLVTAELDALLRQVAGRDVDAFADFYDQTRSRVYGLVTRVLRDLGYSEETTQDVYLQVWRSAASYDPSAGSPLAWLMTLAHRRAVDRVRSEQAATSRESRYGAANVEPPSDHVFDSVIRRDERRQVTECLQTLTDTQRECIQLAYYDGLTYSQVSERLTANLATIKSRMRDAIRGLRRCLGVS